MTLYSLPLTGLDLVLGVQWLEKLGPVMCNWQKMTMEFMWGNQARTLQGANDQVIQSASLKAISKEANQGSSTFAIYLQVADPIQIVVAPDLQQIIEKYDDIFLEPAQLPPTREVEHCITLKDGSEPVNVRPYRYAHFQKAEIEKQVQEMLKLGFIKSSTSPFSSPVLLVKKKDGTWRFCTDYRALNAMTIKDRFPIPTVEDMLDELHRAKYFTKLDLRAGYHQIRVNPRDTHKTAFRTHNGHYEYMVMPFGLCNAPSTFQAIMNSIFRSYLRKFILVFFYDILIYSPNWTMHLEHVNKAFEILRQHKFFVKLTKCAFGQQELEYLGHIVTSHGVKVDPRKIEVMLKWPRPNNISELRGFLGLTGYYRKFVRHYGTMARPLTNLLKKGRFGWNDEAERAFSQLKEAMTTTPVLAMPNFSEPFTIETDASGEGIGAVLTQQGRPLAFMSQALGVTKLSWSIYAKEMLAILQAIRIWRPYLLGKKFFIKTDQRSLKYLLEQRIVTPEQQKWVAKLLGYDYEIIYRPGRENSAADALSRVPGSVTLNALFFQRVDLWDDIKSASKDHPYMNRIRQLAHSNPGAPYTWRDDLVFYKGRVVVPPNTPLIPQLLKEFHDTRVGGHSGVLRTFKRLAQQFYRPSMHKTVENHVRCCETCQKNKADNLSPAGLLQPLPVPSQVWDDITMDFIEGLPKSQGRDTILVVVDRLSKYAHFLTLSHPFTAKGVAEKFVEGVVKLHGMPRSIISDRDPIFMSKFWQEYFKMSGTELKMSSAYHPQTDGQSEVTNRCVEQYLRCFVHHHPRQWSSFLPWAELWYNTTYHSSTGMTPFQALYGRLPPTIPLNTAGSTIVESVDQSLVARDALLQQLKQNLAATRNRMKQIADRSRRDVTFEEGDLVFVKLQPYRQQSVFRQVHQKLASRYFGPYPIEKRVGAVAYKIKLPEGTRIHPVFHVSMLRKHLGDNSLSCPDLPPTSTDGIVELRPEWIMDTRWVKRGAKFVEESLVKWQGLPKEEATWEVTEELSKQYSNKDLEDKCPLEGGRNDELPLSPLS